MEKITKVTQADVGRIAVSLDGDFRVQLMSISQNEQGNNHVKYVEGNQFSPERVGQETFNFGLIGGCDAMYWEDEVKPKKPKTPFESWCAENGYDPKGEFVYDQTSPAAIYSLSFKQDSVLKICYDDNSLCPRFEDKLSNEKFEYFNSHDIYLQQHIKVAKPRFHKKRQKPPVRQKTDVVIHYKTGESYTIKNASSVSVNKQQVIITTLLKIELGIHVERSYTIESNLVNIVEVKAPNEGIEIHNFDENGFTVFFDSGFAIVSQWFKSF